MEQDTAQPKREDTRQAAGGPSESGAVRVCGGLSVHLACSAQAAAAAAAKSCAGTGRPPRKEFRTTASKGIEGPGVEMTMGTRYLKLGGFLLYLGIGLGQFLYTWVY